MSEFDIIEKYFKPLTCGHKGAAGLSDDGAVLEGAEGYELAVTSDTLNEGIHFLTGEAPENIARKALRVNLSDLASMGAKPLCYQLNIAFPEAPSNDWLSAFSTALQSDNAHYGVFCSGGDTTSIKGGFISISITAMGLVPKGRAVRRMNARADDRIIITGPVGDAVLGLRALQDDISDSRYANAIERYRLPQPRVNIVDAVREYAHAAADISDGLLADVMQIAKSSKLGAEVDPAAFSFSDAVEVAQVEGVLSLEDAVCGGDDYELALAVPAVRVAEFLGALADLGVQGMDVGRFVDNGGALTIVKSDAYRFDFESLGWSHF